MQAHKSTKTAQSDLIGLHFDGHHIRANKGASLLEAWMAAGLPLTENVGCLGQGVCGACRVLVSRPGRRLATTALACTTLAEDGMQVAFIDHFPARRQHGYDLHAMTDSWEAIRQINTAFPEAQHCRHCGGCDRACPKGIEVQRMVNLASAGQASAAGALFEQCVMCNLCVAACPEHIDPAHLGQFVRRMNAALALRPSDLIMRIHEIEAGLQPIHFDAEGANPPLAKEILP
ncbi:succinate dehydrogenase/fumarate reductase-like Fe-S protein [Comamonas odontotermitis]|uniref:Succinate dehydrogenase/fumarate reductase-like Fe-S protein n=1 Tax=Comamonas odontotermitis TaxID=379895 RepID=A0ABR6RK12_9BURK|nr:4Fe-4S dicluster domain-containing protein [Comamonas odontotermitis]MBB6579509.1 succinate dehydrogenase/fumarate reductase-like Fe-S protein [Comamonas odontotermitis]